MAGIPRYTKQLLYLEIDSIKGFLGTAQYPMDMKKICSNGGLEINTCQFNTRGLQGMLTIDTDDVGYITLNSQNTPREQNFYCGHEAIHYILHRRCGQRSFQCFETVKRQQDKFIEWHANEGAAEWLMPYKKFIPDLLRYFNPLSPTPDMYWIRECLADAYFVS